MVVLDEGGGLLTTRHSRSLHFEPIVHGPYVIFHPSMDLLLYVTAFHPSTDTGVVTVPSWGGVNPRLPTGLAGPLSKT